MLHIVSSHGGCTAGWGEEFTESCAVPSCAVNKIRNVFTEPTGIYTGFQDSDLAETDEAWRDFN